jgi:hypothetical protein
MDYFISQTCCCVTNMHHETIIMQFRYIGLCLGKNELEWACRPVNSTEHFTSLTHILRVINTDFDRSTNKTGRYFFLIGM